LLAGREILNMAVTQVLSILNRDQEIFPSFNKADRI